MARIFDALRADHERQRSLVDQLLATHGDSEDRRRLFLELKQALSTHAAAEERHFYVPLMENDLTQEKARHSVAEHKDLDDLVEELEAADRSSPGWIDAARSLCERLVHHLDEEEQEVFQQAGRVLSDQHKDELGRSYREEMDERTRVS